MDEITQQITELLQSYRHYHYHGGEMKESEEKKTWEEGAKKALDTFRAMFRGHLDVEHLLLSESENSVLKTLLSLAEKIRAKVTDGREVTSSLEDCSALLMRLTSEHLESTSVEAPPDWPYISKIKSVKPSALCNFDFKFQLLTTAEYFLRHTS